MENIWKCKTWTILSKLYSNGIILSYLTVVTILIIRHFERTIFLYMFCFCNVTSLVAAPRVIGRVGEDILQSWCFPKSPLSPSPPPPPSHPVDSVTTKPTLRNVYYFLFWLTLGLQNATPSCSPLDPHMCWNLWNEFLKNSYKITVWRFPGLEFLFLTCVLFLKSYFNRNDLFVFDMTLQHLSSNKL